MALKFDELINGDSRVRTGNVQVSGLGLVEMHELSFDELMQCAKEVAGKEDEEVGSVVRFWAARMLKGEAPTDKELKALGKKFSNAQITSIYYAGLAFNEAVEDSRETIEKNS